MVFTGAFSGDDPKDMRIGCESHFIHGYYIAVIGTTLYFLKKKKRLTFSCFFPYEFPRYSMLSALRGILGLGEVSGEGDRINRDIEGVEALQR